MTAPRRPRSAWLLVGSTPSISLKVQSAGQSLSRFLAKVRRWRLRALLSAASSSSALSSSLSGAIRSIRRARSASQRHSSQAANSRPAIFRPAAPNCFWAAARPSLWAVKSLQQVRPADLAALGLKSPVGPPAIRAGDAGELLAEQRQQLALVPVGGDAQQRHPRGEGAPERALAAAQAPAGPSRC